MILPRSRGGIQHILFAVVIMGLALWVRLVIAPVSGGLQYVTFFPAVTLAAIIGGYRAGFLATAIGLALATYIFTPPYFSISIEVLKLSFWSNLVFLIDGIVVSVSIEALHCFREKFELELKKSIEAHEVLDGSSRYTRRILDNLFTYVALLDTRGVILEINRAPLDRAGLSREAVIGRHFYDAPWWNYDKNVQSQLINAIEEAGRGVTRRYDVAVQMGAELVPIDFMISPVLDESGRIIGLLPTAVDITERKQAEAALRIAAVAFETHDAIMITDMQANIIRVNQAFTDITGFSREEVIGQNPRIMSSGRQDRTFYIEMWQQLLHAGSWSGEIWDKRKNGQIYPKWLTITVVKNEQREATHYVAIFSDITARKQAEEEIRNLAFYDPLTRLPNRRLFMDRFRAALAASDRRNEYGAILFIDLDRFKVINDMHGHDYGDLLLVEVGGRIKSCIREMDTVGRFGGDEFVVLIEAISNNRDEASGKVSLVAEKIREVLGRPYQLKEYQHHSSPSIGISLFYGHEEPLDLIIEHADMAMYQVKNSGRNGIRFFDPAMQQNVSMHGVLDNDLHDAIELRQLHLYYQIQVDDRRSPIGAEALIRWLHPKRGLLSPAEFIPLAEETGLILPIGQWVLETACAQLVNWSARPEMSHLIVAVNVSALQFQQDNFVSQVLKVLEHTGANPHLLKLELTESMLVKNLDVIIDKMRTLKARGVGFSLDDFGTGYSSLAYLSRLPLDQLKIDRSFVMDLESNDESVVICAATISLAHSLKLKVVAEGIESEAQIYIMSSVHRCDYLQGYLFGKPVPVGQFEELVRQRNRQLKARRTGLPK